MKYKWKVSKKETGRYASFYKRPWPTAYYSNGDACAQILCEDDYSLAKAKSGKHGELKLVVADRSQTPFEWRTIKKRFTTLADLKLELSVILELYPHFMPKE